MEPSTEDVSEVDKETVLLCPAARVKQLKNAHKLNNPLSVMAVPQFRHRMLTKSKLSFFAFIYCYQNIQSISCLNPRVVSFGLSLVYGAEI